MDKNPINIIAGAARTEFLQELNGNEIKNNGKGSYQYHEGVYTDKKNGVVVEVNKDAPISPYSYKYIIDLREKPVNWAQIENLDPNIRSTKGFYMIKYTPRGSGDYKPGRPFKIGQDLLRWDIRVSGKKAWHMLCSKIPELHRLARNSTLSDRMFDLAVKHVGMTFWFSIDWVRYEDKLEAQIEKEAKAETEAEDEYANRHKVFVSRKCSADIYKGLEGTDKKIVLRNRSEVLAEINAVETSPSVQKEMKANTGETFMRAVNTLKRDPKTGRYIKKKEN